MTCHSCKKTIYKRRKKILKTLSWRAIATTTTFCVALALTDDLSKSGVVAAVDTALKTIFYYFHESCYDKAEKKNINYVMMKKIFPMKMKLMKMKPIKMKPIKKRISTRRRTLIIKK